MTQPIYPDPPPVPLEAPPEPRENIYGHVQRLEWLRRHLSTSDRTVEFGCGTGYMITYPLRARGYDVIGVDIDAGSVNYGREVLEAAGMDPEALRAVDLRDVDGTFDAVIASEVLEHLDDAVLHTSLGLIADKLRPGGKLLVTVPNGWGWFELEALLWNRLGVGEFVLRRAARGAAHGALAHAKQELTDSYVAESCASTLAQSPHLQRFTFTTIQRTLAAHGFEVVEARGSVLVCGPLSDLAFTGMQGLMRYNRRLGIALGRLASGFYVAAIRR